MSKLEEAHGHSEHASHGHKDPFLAPVSVTMAALAVIAAAVSVLGHNAHTQAILLQTKATDQWAYYQAKSIRLHTYQAFLDFSKFVSLRDADAAARYAEKYQKEVERYAQEEKAIQEEAQKDQDTAEENHRRGNRFDLSEILAEIALVITSLTFLTRQRIYWLAGITVGIAGILVGCSVLLMH